MQPSVRKGEGNTETLIYSNKAGREESTRSVAKL